MTQRSLSAFLALAVCAASILLLLNVYPSSAKAQPTIDACPATMPSGRDELVCGCAATDGGATVWGTDSYTDDSNLCSAAVHAGAIPATGGIINARAMPGRDYYTGSSRNGVTTRDYGRWTRTIAFEGAKSVASLEQVPLCPVTYNANGTGWSGTCRCVGAAGGAVWGSGTYTADSSLCRAALHAGAIGTDGGVVRVTAAAGRSSYAGNSRNGVTTSNWGSYGTSFTVSR